MTTFALELYQGIEVIKSQQAYVRHPLKGYDEPYKLNGGTHLLLEDGTELVVCDRCGYNGLTGRKPYVKPEGEHRPVMSQADSVVSHIGSAHLQKAPRTPQYDDNEIKVALAVYRKWQETNYAGWLQSAVLELERRGFKPHRAERWTTSTLGSLVRRYGNHEKFCDVKAAPTEVGLADRVMREAAIQAAVAKATPQSRKDHRPVDFEKIIKSQKNRQADPIVPTKEEAAVPSFTQDPVLNFTRAKSEPKKLIDAVTERVVTTLNEPLSIIPQQYPQHPIMVVPPMDKLVIESAYQHITVQEGEPVFMYNGTLMIGKPIRKFEV